MKKDYPVALLCRVMNVSRSGFYRHQRSYKRHARLSAERLSLLQLVRRVAHEHRYSYGSRRLSLALREHGIVAGRYQTRTLMREAQVLVRYKRPFRVTTNSNHNERVYANELARKFTVSAPNKVWVSDISYVSTGEGWLYLAVVLDLYSRKVIGWDMGTTLHRDLPLNALRMALGQRSFVAGDLLHHSDRGVQYASAEYRQLLCDHGIVGSMSRRGNCWDNAVAESFFSRLKTEHLMWHRYQTRSSASASILDYIVMFYNSKRLHSHNCYATPAAAEREYARAHDAA